MSQPQERTSRARVPGPPPAPPNEGPMPPASPETVERIYGRQAAADHAAKTGQAALQSSVNGVKYLPNGMPADNNVPWEDYLLRIPKEFWNKRNPIHVQAYLTKTKPTLARGEGRHTYLEMLEGPIDAEYIKQRYGGFEYWISVNYGQDSKNQPRQHGNFGPIIIDADPKPVAGRPYLVEAPAGAFGGGNNGASHGGDVINKTAYEDMRADRDRLRDQLEAIEPNTRLAHLNQLTEEAFRTNMLNPNPAPDPLAMLREVGTIVQKNTEAAFAAMEKRMPAAPAGEVHPVRERNPLKDVSEALEFVDQIKERFGGGAGPVETLWDRLAPKAFDAIIQIGGKIADSLSEKAKLQAQIAAQGAAIEDLQRQMRRGQVVPIRPPSGEPDPPPAFTPPPAVPPPPDAAPGPLPEDEELANDQSYHVVVHRTILRCIGKPDEPYNEEGKLAGMAAEKVSPLIARRLAELMQGTNRQPEPDPAAIAALGEMMAWSPLRSMIEHPHRDRFVEDFIEEVLGEEE